MDEPFRIKALSGPPTLDGPPDPAFERIVLIGKALTGADTVLMTLIDEDRVRMKAKTGFEGCEAPRDVAFCSHAGLQVQGASSESRQTGERRQGGRSGAGRG